MVKSSVEIKPGKMIGYETIGDPSNPTIILLNGSIFNYTQFYPVYLPKLQKYLGDDFHYVLYNYIGIGQSSHLDGEFAFLDIVDDHKEFVDALDIEEAHLFGLSKGSIIAQLVTAKYPETVLSLAGYGNPNLANDDSRGSIEREYRTRLEHVQSLSGLFDDEVTDQNFEIVYDTVYVPSMFGKEVYKLGLIDRLKNWWIRKKLKPLMMGTQINIMDKLFRYYLRHITEEERNNYVTAIQDIKKPALFMHGDADETIPLSSSQLLAEWIEHAELEIFPGYKHSRPTLLPWQGSKIMKRYAKFLQNLS